MKFLVVLICFLGTSVQAQKYFQYYPVNKDGKWGLMDVNGNEALAPKYDYIRYEKEGDKFVYDNRGKWGIMQRDGKILSEPLYQNIHYLDSNVSIRQLNKKWGLYVANKPVTEHEYDSITAVDGSIYSLYLKDEAFLFHTELEKKSADKYLHFEFKYDMILAAQKSGQSDLIIKSSLSIYATGITNIKWGDYDQIGIVSYADSMQIIRGGDANFISDKYQQISREFGKWFLVKNDTTTYMFDKTNSKTYLILNVDELIDADRNIAVYKKGGKYGAYNYKKGKNILPASFNGLALKSGYLYTSTGDQFGLTTLSGTEIFPPIYENIEDYGNVYVVWQNGQAGIASKSGKIIEPISYENIEIYDKNVKCYKGKTLTTLNIDTEGKLKDRTVYESYMRVNFTKANRPIQKASYLNFSGSNNRFENGDGNNLENTNLYGWFQRKIERTIKDSTFTIYGSWGYKDENDSLRLKHQYQEIRVYNSELTRGYQQRRLDKFGSEASLEAAVSRKLYYKIGNFIAFAEGKYQIVNHQQYYHLSRNFFMNVEMEDWEKYALARAFLKEPVLIDHFGKVIYDNISFYSYYNEDMLRVCLEGEYEFFENRRDPGNLFYVTSILRNFGLNYPIFVNKYNKEVPYEKRQYYDYEPLCRIKGGKWHFVDRNGNLKNEEPFDFAHEFYKSRAIVQRKGKWGVIDTAMNVIVPIEFDKVQRVYVDDKIYFHVYRKHHDYYYYNKAESFYRPAQIDPKKLHNYHNGKWMYTNSILIDTNLTELGKAPYENVFPGYGGYKTVQIGEGYQLLDENGKIHSKVYESPNFWPVEHDRFIVQRLDGNNFAMVNNKGEYLIPKYIGYQLLANTADYIFYLDYNLTFQFWTNKELAIPKKVKVLSGNPEKGLLLCQKGKKKFIYNFKTEEIVDKKAPGIISLENGGMVFKDPMQYDRLGLLSYDGDTLLKGTYWKIDYSGKEWGLGQLQSDQFIVINTKGAPIFKDTFSTVYQDNHSKNYYLAVTSSGTGLLNKNGGIIFPFEYTSITHYEQDIYRLKKPDNDTVYFQRTNGEIVWKITHETDIGFPPNGYVRIGFHKPKQKGWRYFYDGYMNMSMPFSDIYPLSNNTFVLEEGSQEGIYDNKGDTIVPPFYHQVHPVRGKFQVRFFNSFGYINQDKSTLYDPRIIK